MRKVATLIVCFAVTLAAGGCEETRKVLGQTKTAPDEFAVYSRAPLSLPPDYGLRPPAPGATRQQELVPRNQARRVVLDATRNRPRAAPLPPELAKSSPGVKAFLRDARTEDVEPDIRTLVNRETSFLAEADLSFTERIMFWGVATQYGVTVDAAKEAKRIRENQALGRPLTEGDTPTIERKRRALLEGIFN